MTTRAWRPRRRTRNAMVNATQDQVRAAEIVFYKAVIASAQANGAAIDKSMIQALADLGAGGV